MQRWHASEAAKPRAPGIISDFTHGRAWQEGMVEDAVMGSDLRNMGLGVSYDGTQPFLRSTRNKGGYTLTPIGLVAYNTSPWSRMQPWFMWLAGVVPGPASAKQLQGAFGPLVDELIYSQEVGFKMVDAAWTPEDQGVLDKVGGGFNACGCWCFWGAAHHHLLCSFLPSIVQHTLTTMPPTVAMHVLHVPLLALVSQFSACLVPTCIVLC
jgi:hypothetical protein